ncbi:MFS transporter, PAT family, beta-lactamase induction signal transducer AmpG [Isorropodon fossajaponicum endosymbiont JTNG4]|uniref:AmpG family muropeptide MFS transporter n=1 Tax=Isorropodon fossajaponicum symbiont TaxID=883811 RepID=UPI001916A3D0|nr:MFS transporter [Isorropodon fossajaponicum symbiont]BBB24491.1 MFS transporter, PAT family, beta-lactamase induction signal transducer AmpG [Isorropodon fossajaponicum endosymbiont JTNG4]
MSKILNIYLDKRMLFIFLNGVASGFPWVIIGSTMTLWLKDAGLTRTAIGFLGSIFFVYSINWLWAPLLDKVKIPFLNTLGFRRSWLLFLQILLFILIIAISWTDPKISIVWVSLLALLIAITSATQDIVIDAYRIEIISESKDGKIAAAAAAATSGWWFGFGFLGAFALYLADYSNNWSMVYFVMSFFVLGFMLTTLLMPKETHSNQTTTDTPEQWLGETFFSPLKDFFNRFGTTAILILLFIMFFKIGEAFLGKMSLVFYDDIGFSKTDIATYSKLLGSTLTIIFSIIASFVSIHFGLLKGLVIGGVSMALTNLMYSYLATIGADKEFLALTIFLDNFTSAFSTVAFVAFISYLVNKTYTATQYALMSSMGNLGKILFASSSGLLVDSLENRDWVIAFGGEWAVFFAITALMVIPSLVMLFWIGKNFKHLFI